MFYREKTSQVFWVPRHRISSVLWTATEHSTAHLPPPTCDPGILKTLIFYFKSYVKVNLYFSNNYYDITERFCSSTGFNKGGNWLLSTTGGSGGYNCIWGRGSCNMWWSSSALVGELFCWFNFQLFGLWDSSCPIACISLWQSIQNYIFCATVIKLCCCK